MAQSPYALHNVQPISSFIAASSRLYSHLYEQDSIAKCVFNRTKVRLCTQPNSLDVILPTEGDGPLGPVRRYHGCSSPSSDMGPVAVAVLISPCARTSVLQRGCPRSTGAGRRLRQGCKQAEQITFATDCQLGLVRDEPLDDLIAQDHAMCPSQ